MAAFTDLDWTRFDVWAIVAMGGVATITSEQHGDCLAWLRRHDYSLNSVDFARGIGPAIVALGDHLSWENRFGYRLDPENRNLDALRDGLDLDLRPGGGYVLELLHAEVAQCEDARWLSGLLAIAHEQSRWQLARGVRFFVVLVLDAGSPLIGAVYESLSVPAPFSTDARHGDPFAERPVR